MRRLQVGWSGFVCDAVDSSLRRNDKYGRGFRRDKPVPAGARWILARMLAATTSIFSVQS
jgi:hypothetical protein